MSGRVIGAEIGGTKLQVALGDSEGNVLACRRGAAPDGGPLAILEWFAQELPLLLEQERVGKASIDRIGVGFGGPVETATGTVLVSHQVEGWNGFKLGAWFEERFGIQTRVFNDSNSAGWAEYCLGAGRGTRHFMYSNIGSGIGGALVIDGKLHDGQGLGASEVGHTYVPDWLGKPGDACKLEQLCSGWAIERRVRAGADPPPGTPLGKLCHGRAAEITCAMLGEAAGLGDLRAREELERVAHAIGLALANAVTLFHPERIALGGGVSLIGDVLLDPVRRWANHYVFGPFRDRFEIVQCALGESVVLAGAMLLARGGRAVHQS
jgi:glucokinase